MSAAISVYGGLVAAFALGIFLDAWLHYSRQCRGRGTEHKKQAQDANVGLERIWQVFEASKISGITPETFYSYMVACCIEHLSNDQFNEAMMETMHFSAVVRKETHR